jgi:cyclohexyl-isocyanide hydratase
VNSTDKLIIGSLLFPGLDQADFTGPFEVLSRLPHTEIHVLAKQKGLLRDQRGLVLTAEETFAQSPQLDVLHVPGGAGQQAMMDDEEVLGFIREQAKKARYVFSVCTGALICGAAGLLKGRRATTHWASFDLLPFFGAIPVNERVVVDGNLITTAGVTGGIDGAFRLAALVRGDAAAQGIQLNMEYAPQPPFNSGTPTTAPATVLAAARDAGRDLYASRLETAKAIGRKIGVMDPKR